MIRLKREHYAVGEAERAGVSTTIGISYEASGEDDVAALAHYAQKLARLALAAHGGNHAAITAVVQLSLDVDYPGRPFYVETDEKGRGVQVYQPYGMPQDVECRAPGPQPCNCCRARQDDIRSNSQCINTEWPKDGPLRTSDGEYW